ncbi:three-Cys-motif partner protein TcmP [Labrys sp. ZIDIC5]|uniref:three-Cys-motif partner protein TcmP n=1 Tax=Labrys sedimenti TaxID=3106036 RepID=UPI002ACA0306|nr:three-Cys-motif partner protein TcmP [Labrys sp. ZIDIC5]MDZ5453899.1 three-Cys-motif partner protein TcmP [Labrys sp. ZIDIC5]
MPVNNRYAWKIGEPLPLLGKHSVAKHEIFEQYVEIYIDRVTRTPSQKMLNLTVVDGFCGGGLYRQGRNTVDGSPLRLLNAVERADAQLKNARLKGFLIKADFFFVDEAPEHIEFLREQLIGRGYLDRLDKDIFLINSPFEDACPQIFAHIQNKGTAHRSLFFLDQFGWKDVAFATVRSILTQLRKPEILLTFAVDALVNFLSVKTSETQALMAIDLAREDVRALMDMRSGEGWRYLIQNGLYRHIRQRTGASFYTPFFIHSRESRRSYWLLHLSNHRQARDEMGKLHWRINNHFQHHGGAGFHALGFDPSKDLRQDLMPFMFDDDARKRSEATVLEQLPDMIRVAQQQGSDLTLEELFTRQCNETPVTSDILTGQLLFLRDERELSIVDEHGTQKHRSRHIDWTDRIILPRQRSLFSRLD